LLVLSKHIDKAIGSLYYSYVDVAGSAGGRKVATITDLTKAPEKRLFTLLLTNQERRQLAEYAASHDLRGAQVLRRLIRELPDGDEA